MIFFFLHEILCIRLNHHISIRDFMVLEMFHIFDQYCMLNTNGIETTKKKGTPGLRATLIDS